MNLPQPETPPETSAECLQAVDVLRRVKVRYDTDEVRDLIDYFLDLYIGWSELETIEAVQLALVAEAVGVMRPGRGPSWLSFA